MKALRTILAVLAVTSVVASPLAARGDSIQRPTDFPEGGALGSETDIIQAPISLPEGGSGAYYSPPILPENPNPPDPGDGDDLITMTLVLLGLL